MVSGGGTPGGGGGLGGLLGKIFGTTLGAAAGNVPTGTSSGGVSIPFGGGSMLGKGGLGGALSGILTGVGLGLIGSSLTGQSGRTAGGSIKSGIGGFMAGSQIIPMLTSGYFTPLGGGLMGIGIGVGIHGLAQGGVSGLIQSTAGFAEAGFIAGGPIGALIGGAIGAIAGGIRMAISTKSDQMRQLIQQTYGVAIPKGSAILDQIMKITNDQFGGSIHTAVYSLPIRQMIQLYALATGQNARGIVAQPVASQFAQSGGQTTAVPAYFNGAAVYPGQLQSTVGYSYLNPGVYGAGAGSYLQSSPVVGANVVPMVIHVTNSLDGPSTAAFLGGQTVQTIQDNPRLISVAAVSGQDASAARREAAVNVLQPNFVIS
jgi:hypothetical protein